MPLVLPENAVTMPPPFTSVHWRVAIVRPAGTVDALESRVTVCPADGAEGLTLIDARSPRAPATDALASSMPAPQVPVVQ